MPDDDGAGRGRLGRKPLKPARSTHPVARQPADFDPDVGCRRRDRVVVVSLDPQDARRLGSTKANREHRPEHDRHLPEDVPWVALADDALDPVDQLDRLDAAGEHGEERALAPGVRRILAGHEVDVRRPPRKVLTLGRSESPKGRDLRDLLRGHHGAQPRRQALKSVLMGLRLESLLTVGNGDTFAEALDVAPVSGQ
jgi:hypothetical protein